MDQKPFRAVYELGELRGLIRNAPAILAYFSTPSCNVCQALKPKLEQLLAKAFPKIQAIYVDCATYPEIAASFGVFSVPTLVVFFEGREWLRKGRSFSLTELRTGLERPYGMLFDAPAEG